MINNASATSAASTGESTTATDNVRLTFYVTDPNGVSKAEVSNDGITWLTTVSPTTGPGTYIPWELRASGGSKTVYVKFTDGLTHISPVYTQIIQYYPLSHVLSGDKDSKVYPVNVFEEYDGQNKFGSDRSATSTPGLGKSLELKK